MKTSFGKEGYKKASVSMAMKTFSVLKRGISMDGNHNISLFTHV